MTDAEAAEKYRKRLAYQKAYQRAYRERPDTKAYIKAYRQRPEQKARKKAYQKVYMRAYYLRVVKPKRKR